MGSMQSYGGTVQSKCEQDVKNSQSFLFIIIFFWTYPKDHGRPIRVVTDVPLEHTAGLTV